MKKKGISELLIIFLAMLLVIGIIVVCSLLLFNPEDWETLLIDLMRDLLSALVIGLFVGLITKIITNRLFSVQINMKKLRDVGVDGIGTGVSSPSDERKMFGYGFLKKHYPKELKLLFLTGNGYLDEYQDRIVECMDNGCTVKLLITSSQENNHEYLERCSRLYNESVNKLQLDKKAELLLKEKRQTIAFVEKIWKASKKPKNLTVRFYMDEYQNNLRVAKYCLGGNNCIGEDKGISYYWLNVQPMTMPATKLSIALKGSIGYNLGEKLEAQDNNLFLESEKGFDRLWNKYKHTEEKCRQKMDMNNYF